MPAISGAGAEHPCNSNTQPNAAENRAIPLLRVEALIIRNNVSS
jgi:hypothetical protein